MEATDQDKAQIIGEVKINSILDEQGDLAYRWRISGLNDMEIMGMLLTVLLRHAFRVIRLIPPTDEEGGVEDA